MKKLPNLSESKFAKFENNRLANAHFIFGGEKYGTDPQPTGGFCDGVDTECSNGWYYTMDFGHTWSPCDYYAYGVALPDYTDPSCPYPEFMGQAKYE